MNQTTNQKLTKLTRQGLAFLLTLVFMTSAFIPGLTARAAEGSEAGGTLTLEKVLGNPPTDYETSIEYLNNLDILAKELEGTCTEEDWKALYEAVAKVQSIVAAFPEDKALSEDQEKALAEKAEAILTYLTEEEEKIAPLSDLEPTPDPVCPGDGCTIEGCPNHEDKPVCPGDGCTIEGCPNHEDKPVCPGDGCTIEGCPNHEDKPVCPGDGCTIEGCPNHEDKPVCPGDGCTIEGCPNHEDKPVCPGDGCTIEGCPNHELETSSDNTDTNVDANAVNALFNRLMSATTYEELDALMEAMTEEDYVLLGQFTPEQNAALTALVEKLSENPVEELPTQEEQETYKNYLNSRTYPVYVTVIQGSDGFDGIPTEPAYYESTGYAFFQNRTTNNGYVTNGTQAFNRTTENVISADIIKHAKFIPSISSNGVYGLADPTGVATMAMLPGVDFNKLLQGVANTNNQTNFYDSDGDRVDKRNITNYKIIPYVIKVQEAEAGRGWHIDCILVKKGVILAYDLNLPEGVLITSPKEVAAPFAQTHVFQNGETSHDFNIRTISNIPSNNIITVSLGNKTYRATFKGWNTNPDGSGVMYQPNENITISKDATLYAIWEFNPGLGRGDLLVRKTVVGADGNVVADDNTAFTFNLKLPNDDKEAHTYTKYNSSNVSIGGGSIVDNGTFTLMNGQYVVIDDLFPKTDDAELTDGNEAHEGWATITETAADGYTTTWKSGTVNGNATTVTIQDALVTSVICENKSAPKTTTITLDKNVTGNMGDRNKNFTFTVNVDDETFETYTLNHNTAIVKIENVPVGSTVTITESANDGYEVSATVDGETAEVTDSAITIKNVAAAGHAVVFNNDKTATIDTGISLDSIPYILILAGVAAVVGFLFLGKRRLED